MHFNNFFRHSFFSLLGEKAVELWKNLSYTGVLLLLVENVILGRLVNREEAF